MPLVHDVDGRAHPSAAGPGGGDESPDPAALGRVGRVEHDRVGIEAEPHPALAVSPRRLEVEGRVGGGLAAGVGADAPRLRIEGAATTKGGSEERGEGGWRRRAKDRPAAQAAGALDATLTPSGWALTALPGWAHALPAPAIRVGSRKNVFAKLASDHLMQPPEPHSAGGSLVGSITSYISPRTGPAPVSSTAAATAIAVWADPIIPSSVCR